MRRVPIALPPVIRSLGVLIGRRNDKLYYHVPLMPHIWPYRLRPIDVPTAWSVLASAHADLYSPSTFGLYICMQRIRRLFSSHIALY